MMDTGGAAASSIRRIVVVTGSVTFVDPRDVFAVIKAVARLRIRVDVVSLCGAPYILQHTASATGGPLHCPQNHDRTQHNVHDACPDIDSSNNYGTFRR